MRVKFAIFLATLLLFTACDEGKPSSKCDIADTCEGNVRVYCENDAIQRQDCELKQCLNGLCVDPQNSCGNSVVEGNEVCEPTLEHNKSCRDFDPSKLWKDGGSPSCSSDCLSLTQGSCQVLETQGFCGDGVIMAPEICEGTLEHGKTCADFDPTKSWNSDGIPGCSKDCLSLTAGSCKTVSCGDGQIDPGELCDGENLGEGVCQDLYPVNEYIVYKGKPVCASDCKSLEPGTCKESRCGNGFLEPDHNEICDTVRGEMKFLEPKTCSDYNSTITWEEGGTPGCSTDCRALSKGTCREADGPKDGILNCEFTSLEVNETDKTITAHAKIEVDASTLLTNLVGKLSCGQASVPTYTWNLSSLARWVECPSCEPGNYESVADLSYANFGPAEYSCTFMYNSKGGSGSFYLCPTSFGPPGVQDLARPDQMHKFTVAAAPVEGSVLARWDFENLVETAMPKTLPADSGLLSSNASISLSSEETPLLISGTGGYGTGAVSSSKWSEAETLDIHTSPYWRISFSTLGYQDIKVQFQVAGSGTTPKSIAIAYAVSSILTATGQTITFDDKNTFHPFAPTLLEAANNNSKVEVRIYPFNVADAASTIRIDEVIVTGTPITN